MFGTSKQAYTKPLGEVCLNTFPKQTAGENGEGKAEFQVVAEDIELDGRKSMMIKNIPNMYTRAELIKIIDIEVAGLYDLLYLPIDCSASFNQVTSGSNLGYAFINFLNTNAVKHFLLKFQGYRWTCKGTTKVKSF